MPNQSASKAHQRRNELARERGFRSYYEMRRLGGARHVSRQSPAVVSALPEQARQTRRAALEAVSIVRRERIPLSTAARRAGVAPSAVQFWARDALSAGEVRASDRLTRQMLVISEGETVALDVRGSRQAGLVGEYWNAVSRFLETGDMRALAKFRGRRVAGRTLETDPEVLEGLALSGGLQFEDIYSLVG
jgi:hypothetical protein